MKLFSKFSLFSIFFSFALCNYCSQETCRRCCQVTPNGCFNANNFNIRGRYSSYLTFCSDCECDDPNFGCGWSANNFGQVECTSCDALNSIVERKLVNFNFFNNFIEWIRWMWLLSKRRPYNVHKHSKCL